MLEISKLWKVEKFWWIIDSISKIWRKIVDTSHFVDWKLNKRPRVVSDSQILEKKLKEKYFNSNSWREKRHLLCTEPNLWNNKHSIIHGILLAAKMLRKWTWRTFTKKKVYKKIILFSIKRCYDVIFRLL